LSLAGTAIKIELDVTLKPSKCSYWARQLSENFGDDYNGNITAHRRHVSSRTLACPATWCFSMQNSDRSVLAAETGAACSK
jgi:hypothetical protein